MKRRVGFYVRYKRVLVLVKEKPKQLTEDGLGAA